MCARLLLPSASDTEAALLQRVERIETRLDMSIPAAENAVGAAPRAPKQFVRKTQQAPVPAPEPAPPAQGPPAPNVPPGQEIGQHTAPDARWASSPAPEPVPSGPAAPPPPAPESAPPAAGQPDAAAVRSMWPTVREKVRQRNRPVEAMLLEATVRSVEDNTLVLMHPSAPLARRLSESKNIDIIHEALKDALGVDWRVRCEQGTAASATAQTSSVPPPPSAAAEEESMLAEAAEADTAAPRRDPEEVALELLQNELGARKIEG
jgi:DNA polymerase-3 subunit gamma/tau